MRSIWVLQQLPFMTSHCNRLPMSGFLLTLLLSGSTHAQVIEANYSRTAQTLNASEQLVIVISHEGEEVSIEHDWWVAVTTSLPAPNNLLFYNGETWVTEETVAFQQSLSGAEPIEVLSASGLPPASYSFYFGVDPVADSQLDLDSLSFSTIDVTVQSAIPANAQSCGTQQHFFSVDPLESDAYVQIDPLGEVNPAGHTFPTVHTYMILQDKTVPRSVFSPGDITITQINVVESLTLNQQDYSFNFSLCPEVTGYLDHLSDLTDSILNQLGNNPDCQQYTVGTEEFRFCTHNVDIPISAGALLGTVGIDSTMPSAALDFGLRDSRIEPLSYINPARLVNPDQLYVACPYEYYEPGPAKAGLMAKLAVARTEPPRCGTVETDIANTAQGRWYLQGSSDFSENDHLALVPSNSLPSAIGVLSVGNSNVGTDAYFFDFQDAGLINRRFSDIQPGNQIYCFDTLRNREATLQSGSSQAINGVLYLRLESSDLLQLQRSTSLNQCPTDTSGLIFDSSAVSFQR